MKTEHAILNSKNVVQCRQHYFGYNIAEKKSRVI